MLFYVKKRYCRFLDVIILLHKKKEDSSMKQKNVMRGLAGLSATLLAVSSAATAVAATRTDFINSKLGTSSFKLVEKGMERAIPFTLTLNFLLSRI